MALSKPAGILSLRATGEPRADRPSDEDRNDVRTTRVRLISAAVALAALLIAGLAYNVLHSQARARAGLEQEFGRRATLAAGLTTAALNSTTGQWRQAFSGPGSSLPAAMVRLQSFNPDAAAAILDGRGRALATWPAGDPATDLLGSEVVRRALAGRVALSDLERRHGRRLVTIAAPFALPGGGRRIAVEVLPADVIASFASAYLASAPAIRGGRAYLVDGNGRVLASSLPIPQGRTLPDRGLAAALRSRASGTYGDRYFAAATLAGTPWRVVLTTSHATLLAPVQGSTRRTAWLLFAAFVAALIGLVAVGLRALRTSSQLAGAEERERAAQNLAHERLHDALTGLPNRALFLDRTEHELSLAGRRERALAVLFVDLDRFKRINDSLGHAHGDMLLTMVAKRLGHAVREGDTVSRFGGDEFLILCADLEGIDGAVALAGRLTHALDPPFVLGARSVHVSCCIGIAVHAAGSTSADALVRDADAAMYRAKAQGAGSVRVFDADLHGEALDRLDMEVALRAAIAGGELRVHYQPIVALPDGTTCGVEALVRWQRPGVGLVPPLEFIPLAEECGLIGELGRVVLETAMRDVAAWERDGLIGGGFALSVNISARQLASGELPRLVAGLLAGWTLRPAQLWLEITETAVASDPELAQTEIRALSALGVRVVIDDFGVGQSSLEQLVHSLPVDILKLDRSFTSHIGDCREHAVVAAIAPMADALRMMAIAEGVETAEQALELGVLGYPLAQGFHFGRPLDAAGLRHKLAADATAVLNP